MPTTRQMEAMKNVVAKGGKQSIAKSMREAGYSPRTARNPKKLTKSKTWEAMMAQYWPEKEVIKYHQELLKNNYLEMIDFPDTIAESDIKRLLQGISGASFAMIREVNLAFKGKMKRAYVILLNPKARKEALELIYKLQGKFAPERVIDETGRQQLEDLRKKLASLTGDE